MINRTLVEHKICNIFEKKLNLKVPSNDTDLFESGSLDSLSFVELLLQLELEYGIKIPLLDVELADFRSIQRIADLVRQRLAAQNARSENQSIFAEPTWA